MIFQHRGHKALETYRKQSMSIVRSNNSFKCLDFKYRNTKVQPRQHAMFRKRVYDVF